MSEQLYGSSQAGQSGQSGDSAGRLYDSGGRAIRSTSQQTQSTAVQLEDYIREQPLSAVLIALGAGYVLGKIW